MNTTMLLLEQIKKLEKRLGELERQEHGGGGGVTDHGALSGLGDDDHTQYIKHSLATTANDFLVASGAGAFAKQTLAQVLFLINAYQAKVTPNDGSTGYLYSKIVPGAGIEITEQGDGLNETLRIAATAPNVTNGDSHDHVGGDGAQIDHGGLAGLSDDDHTQYAPKASPTFTGTPAAPTPAVDTNTTQIATTAAVLAQINTPTAYSAALDNTSGWFRCNHTLTYASAITFTVSGDKTALYTPGLKLRLTQTSVKYFTVLSSSYGSPNTTVTITGGSDYSLADAAITVPYFSRMQLPEGFPEWFSYTPVWTCSSGTAPDVGNGSLVGSFKIVGKDLKIKLYLVFGSSTTGGNGGNWEFTLPVPCANITAGPPNQYMMAHARDAATANYPIQAQANYASPGPTKITLFASMTAGTNTNYLTNAVPFTWGTGDNFSLDGWYQWSL